MGKGVRTVQRWEERFGLPVRRPNGGSRSICVSRRELDEWLATRWSPRRKALRFPKRAHGSKTPPAGIGTHAELRQKHHQLLTDVVQNSLSLTERCQTLSEQMTLSRALLLRPVSSLEVPPPTKAVQRVAKGNQHTSGDK